MLFIEITFKEKHRTVACETDKLDSNVIEKVIESIRMTLKEIGNE